MGRRLNRVMYKSVYYNYTIPGALSAQLLRIYLIASLTEQTLALSQPGGIVVSIKAANR